MKSSMKKNTAIDFALKVATAMKKISSSHVYFVMQQAYAGKEWGKQGELMSWENAEKILTDVIDDCKNY